MNYFAKLENKNELNVPLSITPDKAQEYNDKGYGIFVCTAYYNGRRKIENLVKINSYYIDLDEGSKEEQLSIINKGLKPSWLVESKRGYQAHWFVKDSESTNEKFKKIARRLVDYYNSDKAIINPVMLLRMPGFYHCKDIDNKFMVKEIYKTDKYYTEKELLWYYPSSEHEKRQVEVFRKEVNCYGEGFFEKLWNMNQMTALQRINGAVEQLEFKSNGGNTYQIWCNGKSTSCWIDKEGKIGSHDNGSPTVWQWLKWYGYNNKEVYQIIKERIPELCQ